jgi:hypothetical protein
MKTQADIDWKNRTLCSDESCIGVIGPDGRCKECGKTYEGGSREEATSSSPGADNQESAPQFGSEKDASEENEDISQTDIDWESRTLCIDESCIGVVGPDGRCKECGKPYSESNS